jgi:hypothetical protein
MDVHACGDRDFSRDLGNCVSSFELDKTAAAWKPQPAERSSPGYWPPRAQDEVTAMQSHAMALETLGPDSEAQRPNAR